MKKILYTALILAVTFLISSCAGEDEKFADIDGNRINQAESEPGNWLAHGRTYSEQRHSPLNQITTENVANLKLEWFFDTGTNRGHEASPIVVDNTMFFTAPWSVVFAVDAVTGIEKWKYDPKVDKAWGINACCDVVNRGVAVWKGKVYVGTIDGRLEALDAKTGEVIWSQLTIDKTRPYTITAAPRIVNDKVIIGNGGAEFGVRGYITAYHSETGKELWRFYTVPGNPDEEFENDAMKMAADTWSGGKWWEIGGGGTVWDSMAYDPDLNLLYIGTGNGSPWNRYIRSPGGGDNLFLSSIVAINPDDGSYVWHFQTTPGDTWDYTATQHMILADLMIDNQERKVIMQAPKNGFFYVIDRTNGKFIHARQFVENLNWATGLDDNGRPIENPATNYRDQAALTLPSPLGGHNWQPMSYSPATGLVYIPTQEIPFVFGQEKGYEYTDKDRIATWNVGVDWSLVLPPKDPGLLKLLSSLIKGRVVAINPATNEFVYDIKQPYPWNGGMLTTAGNLLFQGDSRGSFVAFRADTGEKLWSTEAQTGIIAPPISYQIDGKQYIAIQAGYGGAFALTMGIPTRLDKGSHWPVGRMLVYSLEGKTALPDLPPPTFPAKPPELSQAISKSDLDSGELAYHVNCGVCHGSGAVSEVLPDLRWMSDRTRSEFRSIVMDGTLSDRGMVSFAAKISDRDLENIYAYLVSKANSDYQLMLQAAQ